MLQRSKIPSEYMNVLSCGLPHHLGFVVTQIGAGEVEAEMVIAGHHLAPLNGFIHGGSIITLADTACAVGCVAHLPEDADGFTTVELKSNFLSTERQGTLQCRARAAHLGRSTQVWDATVTHKESGKTIALFRCTQLIMYPRS